MLSLACHEYRSHFAPHEAHPHRASCAACDAWADRIEATLLPAPASSLPAGLATRLRNIARDDDCRRVQSTWMELVEGELPRDLRTRLEGHLGRCPRCRETVAGLRDFLAQPAVPLPRQVEGRLRAIAAPRRRRRPPIWLRQARYAAAASYLLVLLTYQAIGNPLAAARERLEPLRQNATEAWTERSESLSERTRSAFAAGPVKWYRNGEELLQTTRDRASDWLAAWSTAITDEKREQNPSGDEE